MDENDVQSLYGYVRQAKLAFRTALVAEDDDIDPSVWCLFVFQFPLISNPPALSSTFPPTNSEYYYNVGFLTCVDGVLGSFYY